MKSYFYCLCLLLISLTVRSQPFEPVNKEAWKESIQGKLSEERWKELTAMPDSILPQMRYAAKEALLDKYYPRNIDTLYGGYLSTFSYDFKPAGPQDKMIVTQARHTWSTAKAALFYHDSSYIGMSRHGFYFLRDKMWDVEYGGFYNLVTREGAVKGKLKEAYGNAFAIYALSAYFECSGDTAGLGLAQRGVMWLEKHSHDPVDQGY